MHLDFVLTNCESILLTIDYENFFEGFEFKN